MRGQRPNPRKADLQRRRETFAGNLRGLGAVAEAPRQATRGANRNADPLWRVKVRNEGRLRENRASAKSGGQYLRSRVRALKAWLRIMSALGASERPEDRQLAADILRFLRETPFAQEHARETQREMR